ncbi:putative inactive patatin-like protein 9 [Nymphaea thermarum]|nr:putative inactive patatin-like protein 9 [Nymphaea thermarum]
MWRVCRVTAATPGSLGLVRLEFVEGRAACMAIDGGLVMNNPSATVVTHVLQNKRPSTSGRADPSPARAMFSRPRPDRGGYRVPSGGPARCRGLAVLRRLHGNTWGVIDRLNSIWDQIAQAHNTTTSVQRIRTNLQEDLTQHGRERREVAYLASMPSAVVRGTVSCAATRCAPGTTRCAELGPARYDLVFTNILDPF